MQRRPRRFLVLLTGLVLAAGGLAPPGVASGGSTPDDQPLPGYTIVNPPLPPATVHGRPSRVLQGVHRHAAYDIEVPPQWNGELVMWAHGYAGQGKVLTVAPPPFGLRQRLLDQGYAWAASSYYANGYDVRAGVLSTHALALRFGSLVRRPHRTFIIGASMGGHITGRSLEQYPRFYAGGLPMCGVMGDNSLFDFFLDYHLVAQGLAGIRAYPPGQDYLSVTVPKIQRTLGIDTLPPGATDIANPLGRQLRAITVNRSGGQRPGADRAFSFWQNFLFSQGGPAEGTVAEDPGQLATNLRARYVPNTPVDINRTVQRVRPENVRARYSPFLTQSPQIFGVPNVPVLSLHNLGDLFVPFSMERAYLADVSRHGQSKLLVQRAIRSTQHCEFSAAEAGAAWDDLSRWVHRGQRPAGDDLRNPQVIAAADYGCRFSDRDAHAAGSGTRRLYAPCP
ncbi:hypothetical protein [Actinomadura rudentiformis]|uniref:Phthalyl amidase n=1 Tax=Actinomadura rudentiformis TaxID=359158 RepID=A0A6H9YE59_9ACTN|nr:hypothetical protein [Actinomadura rudentiformis]KAB2339506.1 hypothetical protein F8566_48035 [Actinomadura rudentiformis]